MFKTRLLSGILLVILALITLISGGYVTFFVVGAISLIGMYELYRVFQIEKNALGICGYLFAVFYYGLLVMKQHSMLAGGSWNWFMMLFIGFLICLLAIMVFTYP